jgi:hypothetical protein
MDRRTVLKGGITLALTAHPRLAAAERRQEEASGFSVLLARWRAAYREYQAAEESAEEVYEFPGRPQMASLGIEEMMTAFTIGHGRHTAFHSEEAILEAFQRVDDNSRWQEKTWGQKPEQTARVLARNDNGRQQALALYRERKSARDRWEALSGYAKAQGLCHEKCAVVNALERELRDYHPTTMAEVHEKAGFILQNWNEHCDREELFGLLRSFAPA